MTSFPEPATTGSCSSVQVCWCGMYTALRPIFIAGLISLRGLLPISEIRQRFRHSIQNLRRRSLQVDDAAVNQRQRFAFRHLIRELDIGFFERAPEAAHPIAILPYILAFRFIEDVANVSAGIAVGFDDADEILDQLLEKYVVFPERAVRVNQQSMASHGDLFAPIPPRAPSV